MIIRVTTDRLPHKFPKDAEYEVGVLLAGTPLKALVEQGEAYIVGEEPAEEIGTAVEAPESVVEYTREELKEALRTRGIPFKGNAKTTDLEALLLAE